MSAFKEKFIPAINSGVGRFSENTYVKVITTGMMSVMAVSFVSSIFTILGGLPFMPASVAGICLMGASLISNMMTFLIVIGLAANVARTFKQNAVSAIVVSLVCFFILTPMFSFGKIAVKDGVETIAGKISTFDMSYFGSRGIFVGIIVSVIVARLYCLLAEKKITFRMGGAIPKGVAQMFEDILPAIILVTGTLVVYLLFKLTPFGNIHDFIYSILQQPLEGLGGSIWSAVILVTVAELLWFFGIHGSMVTSSVMMALFATSAYANLEAVAAGQAATNIVNMFFIDVYKGPRALGLALLLLLFCRSTQMKAVGKVAIVPSLFSITEPMKFGIPMVLNPWLLIPMTLSAPLSVLIAFMATVIGFLPVVSVNVGRMLPPLISGFVAGGWQGTVVQLIQLAVIVLLYIPFLRKVDKDASAREAQTALEGQAQV